MTGQSELGADAEHAANFASGVRNRRGQDNKSHACGIQTPILSRRSVTTAIFAILPSSIYKSIVHNIFRGRSTLKLNIDQAAAIYTAKAGRHAAFGTSGTLCSQ